MNIAEFLLWEMRSRDTIDVKRCYIDISSDLISGVLLSQVIYWHLPDEQGNSKLRVHHDGHDWLAKKRDDWWGECRITPKQFDRAIEILEKKDLVVTHIYRFDGSPTKHIRMNWDGFFRSLESLRDADFTKRSKSNSPSKSILPKGENPTLPNGKLEKEQRGRTITESTAETTPEITPPPSPPAGGGACEKKSSSLRPEKEEDRTVAVEAKIVTETEEEIQARNHFSVESEKQAIQIENSNPSVDQKGAAARDNKNTGNIVPINQKAQLCQGEAAEFQVFLDAYLAEKPSNFVKHSALSEKHIKVIRKLVKKYGDRSLTIFAAALTWCREQEDDWWRTTSRFSLDNLCSNGKLVEYADKHFDSMESDPKYQARVNGNEPSLDEKRVSPAVRERRDEGYERFSQLLKSIKVY